MKTPKPVRIRRSSGPLRDAYLTAEEGAIIPAQWTYVPSKGEIFSTQVEASKRMAELGFSEDDYELEETP